ncbi:MAG: helix-turn-helix transcriptional regulator [Evtepia sp.]
MTKEEIGSILKKLRLESGKTQKQVAEILGRTQQIVGHWETGYAQPDANTLFVLCGIYDVSVDKAFGFKVENDNSDSVKSEEETQLLKNYRLLNNDGRGKLIDYSNDLIHTGRYVPLDQVAELPPEPHIEKTVFQQAGAIMDALNNQVHTKK